MIYIISIFREKVRPRTQVIAYSTYPSSNSSSVLAVNSGFMDPLRFNHVDFMIHIMKTKTYSVGICREKICYPTNIYLLKVNKGSTRKNVRNMFKIGNKSTRTTSITLVFLLLTLKIFHTFFKRVYS